jgi:hypothetical protein
MDPSVLSLKIRDKKHVVFEIYGNHSNDYTFFFLAKAELTACNPPG